MKTKVTNLQSRKSIGPSPLRLGFLLVPLALACFALSPTAQAVSPPPRITVSAAPTTVNGTATFTIRTSRVNPSRFITVHYTMSGTAILNTDYTLTGTFGQVTIPAAHSFATVTLTAFTGALNKRATMTLRKGIGYTLPTIKTRKTATVTIANAAPIAIIAISDSAPLPLTPLVLATNGIDPTSPVSVSFFNSAGFSFSDQPIRIKADGTVVIAVPLYVDPGTTEITSGTVSMILTQGNSSSPPVSLDIQNLPTLDTYGTQLGAISHASLIMDATLLGRRLNQLQAAQLLFSSVDTSAAQSTVSTLLGGAVRARNDVDRVMLDHSTVITNGTLPNGTSIQFDQNSQDMMDRVIAVYLTGLASVTSNSSAANSSAAVETLTSQSEALTSGAALSTGSLATLIASMEQFNGVADIAKATQDAEQSDSVSESALAVTKGLNSFVGLTAGAVENETVGQVSKRLGAVFGMYDVLRDTGEMLGDLGFLMFASRFGGDPAVLQEATNDINNQRIKAYFDSTQLALAASSLYLDTIEKSASIAGAAIQGLQFAVTNEQFLFDSQTDKESFETAVNVAGEVPAFSSPNQGFAQIEGTVGSPNQATGSPQNSLDLCCFGASGIIGVDDPSGNYGLVVPLGVAGTAYNNLTLSAGDITTGNTLGSETVDLTGLNTSQPVQVPPFSFNQFTTTTYDGTYNGNVTCVAADGSTLVQPVPLAPFGFTLTNGAVVGSGLSGGVDFFGHLNITIPVSGVGAVTFVGTIAFTGLSNGTWTGSGLPDGCTEGGTWSAARQ